MPPDSRGMRDDRARGKIVEWIKGSPIKRSLMFLKKELLVEKAKQLKKSLRPKKGLTIENYRQELEKALSGNAHTGNDSEDEDVPEDSHELHVATEIMSASFLKSQKRGNQEGESKYTIWGQRAEEPLLCQFS